MEDAESFSGQALAALLAELDDPTDVEHPDISISDNMSGWYLSVFAGESRLVVLENDEDDIRHIRGLSSEAITALCAAFGSGDIDAVLRQDWLPGYG